MRKLSHQTDFQADEDLLLLGKLLLDSDYKEKTLTRTFNSLNAHGLIFFVCLFVFAKAERRPSLEEEAKAVGTGEYADRTRICGWYSYSRVMKENLKTQNSQLTDLVGERQSPDSVTVKVGKGAGRGQ